MPRHIGIVACSAEGAALCYRTICSEAPAIMGRHTHPEVSMHTHPLGEYMEHIYRDDWRAVAELMISSGRKLKACGADFLITPDNTIHRAMQYMPPGEPLPWLHIVDQVANEAKNHGYKKLGITGTRYTMESDLYPAKLEKHGIGHVMPRPDERARINQIIFDELVNGVFADESLSYFQQVIERLKTGGCDAVVLGCTEIPLLVTPEASPLPVLDSTRLLARAALHEALR